MISITNPGETAPLPEGWGALLRVQFADACYDVPTIRSWGRMWEMSSRGFVRKHHALLIRAFLAGLPPGIGRLYVHCGAGISRSAAVAKYAARHLGAPFDETYARYNETVFALLLDPQVFDAVLAETQPKKSWWARLLAKEGM